MRPDRFLWRWRERVLAAALVIAGAVSFLAVRHAAEVSAQRRAQQHAETVSLKLQTNAARAAAYVDALRGDIEARGATSEAGFSSAALGILSLADLSRAAWVQPVGAGQRRGYEASIGRPITDPRGSGVVSAPNRRLYYPATLITEVLAADLPGVDLGAIPQLRSVLASPEALFSVIATAPVNGPSGPGVYFVEGAPRRVPSGNVPGFIVVFVPVAWLEGSLGASPGPMRLSVGGGSVGRLPHAQGDIVHAFTMAGRRWRLMVPTGAASTTAIALAWSLLAAGLALAGLALLLDAQRRRAEQERRSQLWFLESLDRVNRAIQGTQEMQPMLEHVLDETLTIFNCERAWLIHSYGSEINGQPVVRERTRPECADASPRTAEEAEFAEVAQPALASSGPVRFDPAAGNDLPRRLTEGLGVRSAMAVAVHAKIIRPSVLAVARCSRAQVWSAPEERLLQEIAWRLAEALDSVLLVAGLRESERKIEKSRAEVERLADEQAALRRVATLVAHGARPVAVFGAVAAEVDGLLDADGVLLGRYEPGGEVTFVAHRGANSARVPAGTRVSHEGRNVTTMVRHSGRPARLEDYGDATGAIGKMARDLDIRASVGVPIVVDGRLWGLAIANWSDRSPPADTEERMAQFAELLDTAIANADGRDQLRASRARLLTTADEVRRRVVRDLHDGAQQRLVQTVATLRLAQREMRRGKLDQADALVAAALEQARVGNAELRELAHGILPAALTRGGLPAGLAALRSRLDVPVLMDVPNERFAPEIEASAYFTVAEALTNVVKHAHAGEARVRVAVSDGRLNIEVRDNGAGGADPAGHGLVGMSDRVTALGGRLQITSPPGRGTVVTAILPVSAD
jgi:signal transduction histidine kinase